MPAELEMVFKARDEASGVLGKIGNALGGVAKISAGFAIGQGLTRLPALIGDIGAMSRQMELDSKKALTVLGEELADVQQWAKQSANAMGLTGRQATSLAANFADLLIPMGFTRDEAAKMATDTVGLSGALSEWSGGTRSAAEVSDILAKAMLGERDALKGLGISISELDVSQRLASMGAKGLTGAALEQAKAVATQALILEKSTDAQKAYADGAGSAARRQAEMTAKMAEAKETLAASLAPAMVAITNLIATEVMPAMTKVIGVLEDSKPAAIGAAIGLGILLAAAMPIPTALAAIVIGGALLINHWAEIKETLIGVGNSIIDFFRNNWPEIASLIFLPFAPIAIAAKDAFGIRSALTDAFHGIVEMVRGAINDVIGFINRLISAWNGLEFKAGGSVLGVDLPSISFGTPNLPMIPMLQMGSPFIPRDMLAFLHEGEAVVPAHRARNMDRGQQGITVQFLGPVYATRDEAGKVAGDIGFAVMRDLRARGVA